MRLRTRVVGLMVATMLILALHPQAVPADQRRASRSARDNHDNTRSRAACGLTFLPLDQGNTWTYAPINPPSDRVPANVTIRVIRVTTAGTKATITLEESYRGTTHTSEATCDTAGLMLPPDSFFFLSEPGTALRMALNNTVYEGVTFPTQLNTSWFVGINADVVRGVAPSSSATYKPAKLKLERLAKPGGRDRIAIDKGSYVARRVDFTVQGSSTMDPDITQPIQVRDAAAMWFIADVGVVKSQEISGRQWQLVASNLLNR